MQIKKDLRPKIHYTPERNWMNDPNGMICINGQYHLFYQNNPDADVWGPMNWGHAVSSDLIHWNHLPIALKPDELGYIFSGSCVLDKENLSGLGTKENPPLIAIYTSHNHENGTEVQSIAYSLDYIHFTKYADNPIISNPGIKDFRDPKVFYSSDGKGFCLAIAAYDRIMFYRSDNLISWTESGEFLLEKNNGFTGIAECPDCFCVDSPIGKKWILIVSMIINPEDHLKVFHKTQYFIGDFDGNTFISSEKMTEPLLLNYGMDYYAAVSFSDSSRPIVLGWADNWAYANKTPSRGYRGQMSLATEVSLIETKKGLRISNQPLGLDILENAAEKFEKHVALTSQSFGLLIQGIGRVRIKIYNSEQEEFVMTVDDSQIMVDRTHAGQTEFDEQFKKEMNGIVNAERFTTGEYDIRVIFDVFIFEIYAENGLIPISMTVYPEHPYTDVIVEGVAKTEIFQL